MNVREPGKDVGGLIDPIWRRGVRGLHTNGLNFAQQRKKCSISCLWRKTGRQVFSLVLRSRHFNCLHNLFSYRCDLLFSEYLYTLTVLLFILLLPETLFCDSTSGRIETTVHIISQRTDWVHYTSDCTAYCLILVALWYKYASLRCSELETSGNPRTVKRVWLPSVCGLPQFCFGPRSLIMWVFVFILWCHWTSVGGKAEGIYICIYILLRSLLTTIIYYSTTTYCCSIYCLYYVLLTTTYCYYSACCMLCAV